MTTAIKRRRGTTAQHSTFTGLDGELTIDTTKKTVIVHDGATAGGTPLAREAALAAHTGDTANPHAVTKSQVNLGNVDNTSDASKPVSTAQQAALDLKATVTSLTAHTGDTANPHAVTKTQVGLPNVDNTSDVNKPVSTAQQAALDLKATVVSLSSHTGNSANPHAVTKAQVNLGNVDNTSDANKPVSTAQAAAIASVPAITPTGGTLAVSGNITANNSGATTIYSRYTNASNGSGMEIGVDAAGGAYISSNNATAVKTYINGTARTTLDSTGLAVTGTGTFSGNINANGDTVIFTAHSGTAPYLQHSGTQLDIKGGAAGARFLNNAATANIFNISNTGDVTAAGGVTAAAASGFAAGGIFIYEAASISRFGGSAATTRLYANSAGVLDLTSGGGTLTGALTLSSGHVVISSATIGAGSQVWLGSNGGGGGFWNVPSGNNAIIGVNNASVLGVTSAGVAVTGTGSFTGSASIGTAVAGTTALVNVGDNGTGNSAVRLFGGSSQKGWQIGSNITSAGALEFAVATAGGGTTFTEKMRIDTSGNLGIGVVPSAWYAADRALELGALGNSVWSAANASIITVTANMVDTVSGQRYARTDFASSYQQYNGSHTWLTAASGTAGNAITWTTAMVLDGSGNLRIGAGTALGPLTIQMGNTDPVGGSVNAARDLVVLTNSTAGAFGIRPINGGAATYDGGLAFISQTYNGSAYVWKERARIDAYGNFQINRTINQPTAVGGTVYNVDTSGAAQFVGNGSTVSFNAMSGMIVVTDNTGGTSGIWLTGGGAATAVGNTVGGMTYNSGINGYTFTNNTGADRIYSFFVVRMRANA